MLDVIAGSTTKRAPFLTGEAMNWINGAWVDSSKRTDSFDPATGRRIGNYADAGHADAETATKAAVQAFVSTDWKDNRKLRAKVLNQIADRFEARREALIGILSLENGKVHDEAAFEVDMIPSKFRYWASVVLTEYGRAMEVLPGHLSVVTRSAIGVAGIVAPFNSPLVLTVRSLAPALAAGVTTVIKPPGNTAQTNFLFSQVLSEAADLAFYRPTLLEVTDPKMTIVQEEVFGPVLTMQVFETEAEAIHLANDSEYGLAASIWTRDVDRPLRVAREIDAGTIWINDWAIIWDEFEEGGFKRSGNGRLNGLTAMTSSWSTNTSHSTPERSGAYPRCPRRRLSNGEGTHREGCPRHGRFARYRRGGSGTAITAADR